VNYDFIHQIISKRWKCPDITFIRLWVVTHSF